MHHRCSQRFLRAFLYHPSGCPRHAVLMEGQFAKAYAFAHATLPRPRVLRFWVWFCFEFWVFEVCVFEFWVFEFWVSEFWVSEFLGLCFRVLRFEFCCCLGVWNFVVLSFGFVRLELLMSLVFQYCNCLPIGFHGWHCVGCVFSMNLTVDGGFC